MHCIVFFIDNVNRAEPSGSDLLNHINWVGQGEKDYLPLFSKKKGKIHKTVKTEEPTHSDKKLHSDFVGNWLRERFCQKDSVQNFQNIGFAF